MKLITILALTLTSCVTPQLEDCTTYFPKVQKEAMDAGWQPMGVKDFAQGRAIFLVNMTQKSERIDVLILKGTNSELTADTSWTKAGECKRSETETIEMYQKIGPIPSREL